jgi:hypothetical protein
MSFLHGLIERHAGGEHPFKKVQISDHSMTGHLQHEAHELATGEFAHEYPKRRRMP